MHWKSVASLIARWRRRPRRAPGLEGFLDAADFPRGHALQIARRHCTQQRLLVPLIPGEHRRLEEAGPIAGHAELDLPDPRIQPPREREMDA